MLRSGLVGVGLIEVVSGPFCIIYLGCQLGID